MFRRWERLVYVWRKSSTNFSTISFQEGRGIQKSSASDNQARILSSSLENLYEFVCSKYCSSSKYFLTLRKEDKVRLKIRRSEKELFECDSLTLVV